MLACRKIPVILEIPPVNQLIPDKIGCIAFSIISINFARIPETNCSATQRLGLTIFPIIFVSIFTTKSIISSIRFSKIQNNLSKIVFVAFFAIGPVTGDVGSVLYKSAKNFLNKLTIHLNIPLLILLIISL